MQLFLGAVLGCAVFADAQATARLQARVLAKAQSWVRAYRERDAAALVAAMDAEALKRHGGTASAAETWKTAFRQQVEQNLRIQGHELGQPGRPRRAAGRLFALIPWSLTLKVTEGQARLKLPLLAVSADAGKSWTFHDGQTFALRQLWPNLPDGVAPQQAKLDVTQRTKRVVFNTGIYNFKISQGPFWNVLEQQKGFVLVLQHATEAVFISALIQDLTTLEEDVEALVQSVHQKKEKVFGRKQLTVAGVPAEQVRIESGKGHQLTTVFHHQGIGYAVHGMSQEEFTDEFLDEYQQILDSWAFVRDRQTWLNKTGGKRTATALAGGLAYLSVVRPRWAETTFDEIPSAGDLIDSVSYRLYNNNAWITVNLVAAHGSAQEELQRFQDSLAATIMNAQARRVEIKGPDGPLPAAEVVGFYAGKKFLRRVAVIVRDGVAAQFYMDCPLAQRRLSDEDWAAALRDFVLHPPDRPPAPLAFSPRQRVFQRRPADPALAAWLARARQILPYPRSLEVRAVSDDGRWLFSDGGDGCFVENLATKQRDYLQHRTTPGRPAAVARDGAVAFADDTKIYFTNKKLLVPYQYEGRAQELAFAPDGKSLYVVVPNGRQFVPGIVSFAQPYNSSRLELLDLTSRRRKVLIDEPLGRVEHPVVSPDGRQLALVSNRDYPRSQFFGGHIYVGPPDGSKLRRLSHDPGDVKALAWSRDGASLYAVRRLAPGKDGAVGPGGDFDLYRIEVATGAAVNLTHSGKVGRVWPAFVPPVATGAAPPPDATNRATNPLLVEVQDFRSGVNQQGLWNVAAEELLKVASSRPNKTPLSAADATRLIADKVKLTAAGKAYRDVIPDAALLEKAAQAFAATGEALGVTLDFSVNSLYSVQSLATDGTLDADPWVHLGLAAYYGETLRRTQGAEWRLQPLPLGEWAAGQPLRLSRPANALAEVVLPFTETSWRGGSQMPLTPDDLQYGFRKIILVYPPKYAEQALAEASGPEYPKARAHLDAGRIDEALAILTQELVRRPKSTWLAQEVISLCEITRRDDLAEKIARQAVLAGNETPDLLVRYADSLAKTDAGAALEYYRRAAQQPWPQAPVLLKLGKAYARAGETALAESCYRRAHAQATPSERQEIRRLLNMPPPLPPPGPVVPQ